MLKCNTRRQLQNVAEIIRPLFESEFAKQKNVNDFRSIKELPITSGYSAEAV